MKQTNKIFNGLGFPIVLLNAKIKNTEYGEVLDVDFNKLSELVFEALIRKPSRFSGAEVKFIRNHMELSQNVFGNMLDVDRSSVGKWEAKDLKPTQMMPAVELSLRIQMAQRLRHSVDRELPFIQPGIRKKDVGKPLKLAV